MEIQIQEGGRRPDEVNRELRQTRERFALSVLKFSEIPAKHFIRRRHDDIRGNIFAVTYKLKSCAFVELVNAYIMGISIDPKF
jgi:hypothetical protein